MVDSSHCSTEEQEPVLGERVLPSTIESINPLMCLLCLCMSMARYGFYEMIAAEKMLSFCLLCYHFLIFFDTVAENPF